MKAILKTYRPEWLVNVLNGEADILLAKYFPKDYVGWVYIYCSKVKPYVFRDIRPMACIDENGNMTGEYIEYDNGFEIDSENFNRDYINGKVVARFWCDKVEKITCGKYWGEWECCAQTLGYSEISQASCLKNREIVRYLRGNDGYAIHISKLEVFDRLLYLDDFTRPAKCRHCEKCEHKNNKICDKGFVKMFDKAPSNYCYIKI